MSNVVYTEYMASNAWKAKRELIYKRCNGRCEVCSSRLMTEVHHKTYIRLGKERLGDLVGVCAACHAALHGVIVEDKPVSKQERKRLNKLKMKKDRH